MAESPQTSHRKAKKATRQTSSRNQQEHPNTNNGKRGIKKAVSKKRQKHKIQLLEISDIELNESEHIDILDINESNVREKNKA